MWKFFCTSLLVVALLTATLVLLPRSASATHVVVTLFAASVLTCGAIALLHRKDG